MTIKISDHLRSLADEAMVLESAVEANSAATRRLREVAVQRDLLREALMDLEHLLTGHRSHKGWANDDVRARWSELRKFIEVLKEGAEKKSEEGSRSEIEELMDRATAALAKILSKP